MLEVLVYLLEGYIFQEFEFDADPDEKVLGICLRDVGFGEKDIDNALSWIQDLVNLQALTKVELAQSANAIRVFSELERDCLTEDAQGFLLELEAMGAIDAMGREVIIDRCLALELNHINKGHVEWVADMMVMHHGRNDPPLFPGEISGSVPRPTCH